ncbi:MAG: glycosyltransferase [Chromatiaceae bacterium]|nr:MAG: glycosyltransferase [Chromatiaceae bacterium]
MTAGAVYQLASGLSPPGTRDVAPAPGRSAAPNWPCPGGRDSHLHRPRHGLDGTHPWTLLASKRLMSASAIRPPSPPTASNQWRHLADRPADGAPGPAATGPGSGSGRTAILVAGMHRTGTSAVTRAISLLGAELPRHLMPALAQNNDTGFWESLHIYSLNERLLAALGATWDNWPRLHRLVIDRAVRDAYRDEALAVLDQEFGHSELFVLKDPRLSVLLPFWQPVLEAFGAQVRVVLPVRSPLETAASLRQRDGFDQHRAMLLWLTYLLRGERDSRQLPRVFVPYAGLLSNPDHWLAQIAAQLAIVWPRDYADVADGIRAFLSPGLRHHVVAADATATDPRLPALIRTADRAFGMLQSDPYAAVAIAELDALSSRWMTETPGGEHPPGSEESARRLDDLLLELTAYQTQLQQIEDRLGALEQPAVDPAEGAPPPLLPTAPEYQARLQQMEDRLGALEQQVLEPPEGAPAPLPPTAADPPGTRLLAPDPDQHQNQHRALQSALAQLAEARELNRRLLHRLNFIQSSTAWVFARRLFALEQRAPGLLRLLSSGPKLAWWAFTLKLPDRLRLRREAARLVQDCGFDLQRYLESHPEVVLRGENALLHYLLTAQGSPASAVPITTPAEIGSTAPSSLETPLAREIREIHESGLFDSRWYRETYPDVVIQGIDPVEDYCCTGWRRGRHPNSTFDTGFYLRHYPDIARSEINPFHHYVCHGRLEGRAIHPQQGRGETPEPKVRFGSFDGAIKPIAFYLPQFHVIPENEEWWGTGFTEWTNVRAATPLFAGHDQPRVPHPDLGYYDLSDWRVLDRQARLATAYGLYGFCFYHYYFAGKRLLERPVDLLLEHPEIPLRFCLCWANENWTRTWDGGDDEILMAQAHSPADDLRFIDDLARYLADPRYIRVDGKALLLIYRPALIDDMATTVDRWRQRLRERGLGELHLVCTYGAFADVTPPADYGCDAAVEFPPNVHLPGQQYFNYWWRPGCQGWHHSYRRFVQDLKQTRAATPPAFALYRSVMLAWDNTPRRGTRGTVYREFSPAHYRDWLDSTIAATTKAHPVEHRLLFINAWNEWAEGTYLEPDTRYGYRLLNETARALKGIPCGRPLPLVSVLVPNYNHARFLRQRLHSIYQQSYQNIEVLLLDDCSSDESRAILDEFAQAHPDITTRYYNDSNSGSVFRQWRHGLAQSRGDLVWIAESDDFCDLDFLDRLVACFEDEAVMLAYCRHEFVDDDGAIKPGLFDLYVGALDGQKWHASYVNSAHHEVASALGIRNTIPNVSGCLFRRPLDLALLDDPRWLSMRIAGDWLFYLEVIRGGKLAYSVETTNYFRFHAANTSVATYTQDVYYQEHGAVALHVASHYAVPAITLQRNYELTRQFYFEHGPGKSSHEFDRLYPYQDIQRARRARLPNLMVSALGFGGGGAETTPITLANELKRQGVGVAFHSLDFFPDNPRVRAKLRHDIPVVRAADAAALRTAIADLGTEVFNSHHLMVQQLAVTDTELFANVAHVATLHGVMEVVDAADHRVLDAQLPVIDAAVARWTHVADKNLRPFQMRAIDQADKFIKIPNGLPRFDVQPIARAALGLSEEAFVLCLVSRAIPEKGWAEAIDIVGCARERSGSDVQLLLVGDGPVLEQLRANGTAAFVHLIGFSEQPMAYFATADMGLLPSRYTGESMPNSVIECLFTGKPVIASELGEIRDMLTLGDRLAGGVIPMLKNGCDIAAAAELVAQYATDRTAYAAAVSAAREIAPRFDIARVAGQYLDAFVTACSAPAR